MRWIRLLLALVFARFRERIQVNEASHMHFRVWVTDVDASIMNHAALMTVMEAGRIDLMVRSGFFALARRQKWYVPSSAISVQFIRPLKIFQRALMTTRVFHMDEKWIFIEHKITRKGKEIAVCLVKSTIKKGREHLDPRAVLQQLGMGADYPRGGLLIQQFEQHQILMREEMANSQ
jgi:acyl-CoA thioesterase FadM